MFRRTHIRTRSAMFYPRSTPSMIVDNIPSLTVVQMAAFQFGDRPVWVGCRRSPIGHKPISVSESPPSNPIVCSLMDHCFRRNFLATGQDVATTESRPLILDVTMSTLVIYSRGTSDVPSSTHRYLMVYIGRRRSPRSREAPTMSGSTKQPWVNLELCVQQLCARLGTSFTRGAIV